MIKFNIQRCFVLLCFIFIQTAICSAVTVELYDANSNDRPSYFNTMERNLANLLDEIDKARNAGAGYVSCKNINMSEDAKRSLGRLWTEEHFSLSKANLIPKLGCWVLQDRVIVRNIPLEKELKSDEDNSDILRLATVEFDKKGMIVDFRYQLKYHFASRFEELDRNDFKQVQDVTEQMIIYDNLEKFRTAYNKKDIATIEKFFSDDALIITGSVIQSMSGGDSRMMTPKVKLNRQSKQQYIANLKRAFERNSWIHVDFDPMDNDGNPTQGIMPLRSKKDPSKIAVRVKQRWNSSRYNDEGVLFLIWDFNDHEKPIIHVRTWQPLTTKDAHGNNVEVEIDDEITTLAGFDL